jgi:hypothetical protein
VCVTKDELSALLAGGVAGESTESSDTDSGEENGPLSVTMELIGNNPAEVEVGAMYSDMGARAVGPEEQDLTVHIYMNDEEVEDVAIDTSIAGIYEVVYRATYDGDIGEIARTIIVGGEEEDVSEGAEEDVIEIEEEVVEEFTSEEESEGGVEDEETEGVRGAVGEEEGIGDGAGSDELESMDDTGEEDMLLSENEEEGDEGDTIIEETISSEGEEEGGVHEVVEEDAPSGEEEVADTEPSQTTPEEESELSV